jgi:hypothetical protein
VVEFAAVLGILQEIAETTWLLAHGGREIYRGLLNGLLGGLIFACAEDWRDLLAFPEKALDWTEADGSHLDIALQRYRDRGIYDEIGECTTLDQIVALRKSLDQLVKEFGIDFAGDIDTLEEQIADRQESDDRNIARSGISESSITRSLPMKKSGKCSARFMTAAKAGDPTAR